MSERKQRDGNYSGRFLSVMKIDVPMMFLFSLEVPPCEMIISFMGERQEQRHTIDKHSARTARRKVCFGGEKRGESGKKFKPSEKGKTIYGME